MQSEALSPRAQVNSSGIADEKDGVARPSAPAAQLASVLDHAGPDQRVALRSGRRGPRAVAARFDPGLDRVVDAQMTPSGHGGI